MKIVKKILKWVGNIIFILLILCVIGTFFSLIQAKRHPGKIPSLFGYKGLTVLTGSMKPQIQPGDVVIAKDINPEEIKEGDIITYRLNASTLVTHRVVEVINKDGQIQFKTKGDANNVEDAKLVTSQQLIGKNVYFISKGGSIAQFIRTPKGFVMIILIPVAVLIGSELVKTIKKEKEEKKKDNERLEE
ncbi:signal peptidase I [Clostridium ganghwense]|uniref:Signal peptidase I n=1 Tax=Clostridium ganghwense TaxID=312089 RepID=A0ABT4CSH3_9CLOT|nr:signal peptidase I [Clostridium ganghwense]MCY6371368.1 signal peptidase I [Clostridium ganghwense]